MNHIFYFITALAVLVELGFVLAPKVVQEASEKTGSYSLILIITYIGGLFTFQWIFFILHTIYVILRSPINILLKDHKNCFLWVSISSIPQLAFLVFVIINKYHLHITSIQLLNLIQQWI